MSSSLLENYFYPNLFISSQNPHCVLSNPHLNKTNKISKCADLNLNWQIKCLVLIPKILRRFNYKIFYILRILLFCKFYVLTTVTLFTRSTLLVRLRAGKYNLSKQIYLWCLDVVWSSLVRSSKKPYDVLGTVEWYTFGWCSNIVNCNVATWTFTTTQFFPNITSHNFERYLLRLMLAVYIMWFRSDLNLSLWWFLTEFIVV